MRVDSLWSWISAGMGRPVRECAYWDRCTFAHSWAELHLEASALEHELASYLEDRSCGGAVGGQREEGWPGSGGWRGLAAAEMMQVQFLVVHVAVGKRVRCNDRYRVRDSAVGSGTVPVHRAL